MQMHDMLPFWNMLAESLIRICFHIVHKIVFNCSHKIFKKKSIYAAHFISSLSSKVSSSESFLSYFTILIRMVQFLKIVPEIIMFKILRKYPQKVNKWSIFASFKPLLYFILTLCVKMHDMLPFEYMLAESLIFCVFT